MYSVWFNDLEAVILKVKEKLPNMATFGEIKGNAYGDFVIKSDTDTYIVKHDDLSIWHMEGDWRSKKWVEVK